MARAKESEVIYIDTHVACWLYEGRLDLLSRDAVAALDRGHLFASPIVDLELKLLHEMGRIAKGLEVVLHALAQEINLELGAEKFSRIVGAARELNWTRDPFDRLIVAEAMLAEAGLVTKDRLIRKHFAAAIW